MSSHIARDGVFHHSSTHFSVYACYTFFDYSSIHRMAMTDEQLLVAIGTIVQKEVKAAVKEEVKAAVKEEVKAAVKEEMKHLATKEDVNASENRLRADLATKHDLGQTEARLSGQIHDVGVEVTETRAFVLQREHPHAWRAAA